MDIIAASINDTAKALSLGRTSIYALIWEQEDLKSHELPNVPKMDINSGSYPIFARGLGLRSDGLARAIWDHLGPLTTTVSGTVGGPPGVGSAARTSNFERGEV